MPQICARQPLLPSTTLGTSPFGHRPSPRKPWLDERIALIWSDRVNSAWSGLLLYLPFPFPEDRASSSLGRFQRRLISLIFAGQNRIIMIRRELPLTVIAGPAEPVA